MSTIRDVVMEAIVAAAESGNPITTIGIAANTQINELYIRDAVRALLEERLIRQSPGGWELHPAAAEEDIAPFRR